MALQSPRGRIGSPRLKETPEAAPGAYLLVLRVDRRREVEVGALGRMELTPGRYAYAGSALGPGGVRARLERHLRASGRPHWHVDHLRSVARPESGWWVHADERLECRWAAALTGQPGTARPVAGFGASDCGCPGHLVRLPDELPIRRIRAALADVSPPGRRPARASVERILASGED